jgi:hypothetical protein
MNTERLKATSDADGKVRIEIPTSRPNQPVDVLVVWNEEIGSPRAAATDQTREGRRQGLLAIFGSLRDEVLERPEQLPFEVREDLP